MQDFLLTCGGSPHLVWSASPVLGCLHSGKLMTRRRPRHWEGSQPRREAGELRQVPRGPQQRGALPLCLVVWRKLCLPRNWQLWAFVSGQEKRSFSVIDRKHNPETSRPLERQTRRHTSSLSDQWEQTWALRPGPTARVAGDPEAPFPAFWGCGRLDTATSCSPPSSR